MEDYIQLSVMLEYNHVIHLLQTKSTYGNFFKCDQDLFLLFWVGPGDEATSHINHHNKDLRMHMLIIRSNICYTYQ